MDERQGATLVSLAEVCTSSSINEHKLHTLLCNQLKIRYKRHHPSRKVSEPEFNGRFKARFGHLCEPQHPSLWARLRPSLRRERTPGPDWRTALAARQGTLDVDFLGDTQRIFKFDAEVSDRAIDLGMP